MKKLSILIFSFLLINSLSAQTVDSIIDIRDSQVYKVVKIGQQWWMQENLNIGIMIDSAQYWADNDTIEKYCYRNSDSLCNIYGGLYEWSEMMDYNPSDTGNPGITRGICPIGWHLPTYNEWSELVNLVGGESGQGGGLLKEAGIIHWKSPNTNANNSTGFTALPGGYRYFNSSFVNIGKVAYFWTSTGREEYDPRYAWFRYLSYDNSVVSLYSYVKDQSFSVRCLHDADQFSYLTISDKNLKTILKEEFFHERISDTIIIINSAPEKTVVISSIHNASSNYELNESSAILDAGENLHLIITFHAPLDDIYYFDTLKIESNDPYNPVIKIPLIGYKPIIDSIIDNRDNQVYGVVKIGQQWWMQENLNIGTRINGNKDATDNGIIEKYCSENNTDKCNIYGGMYQWNEMMDYNLSDNGNPGTTRGICPLGWHLPANGEWTELTDFLGGASIAGGKMKETGAIHWVSPNTGANNASGFTALGGDARSIDGNFYNMGKFALYWSPAESNSDLAWHFRLSYDGSEVLSYSNYQKIYGFSVRCLKDYGKFSYLTVSDINLKSVSDLNFYNYNDREELIIINSGAGKTINIVSINTKSSAYILNKSASILLPGDSIHLSVNFNPPVKGIYPDTIYIESDDPYRSVIKIPVFGTFPLEISITDSSDISCFGYSNGSATITPLFGTPPYYYQWDDDESTTDSIATNLKPDIYYHVIVTDSRSETMNESIILSEPEQPLNILSEYTDTICLYSTIGNIKLSPSGGTPSYTYLWSNGAETQNISGLSAGHYSVLVTDNNGCENVQEFIINSAVPYNQEKICIVTIDLISGKNIIVWEKTSDKSITTYNIYREFDIGQFTYIGSRDVNDLSIFRDETANPESRSYLYKITVTDTCGNESSLESTPYHWPSFLQYVSSVGGINLSWTDYKIEGIDNVGDYLSSYVVYRGTDSTGLSEYQVVGRQLHFTDKDPDALIRKYYYRVVGILKDPCYPTGSSAKKDEPGPYIYSMSNIEDNRILTGLPGYLKKETLSIHPNPFGENAILTFNNPDGHPYTLYIMDLSGKVCRIVNNINTSRYILEKGDLQEGFYIIELRGPEIYRERIIVE